MVDPKVGDAYSGAMGSLLVVLEGGFVAGALGDGPAGQARGWWRLAQAPSRADLSLAPHD
jgi:hypothetical protein